MKKLIVGTDWWTDCDDAVALRVFARAHRDGLITLAGVVINACMEYSVASVDAFLRLEGVDGIPLAIDLEATDFGRNPPYQKRLAERWERPLPNSQAETPVRLYRRLLATAEGKVELAEIGYLQALAAFLQSPGDDISPLSGPELAAEKVERVWMMAGKWPTGTENNFARNERSRRGAAYVVEKCPVPITFLGYEVGATVISGGKLSPCDHLHAVLADHGSPNGRCSWDPMLAMLAIGKHRVGPDYDSVTGTATVDAQTGENHFTESMNGRHTYLIKKRADEAYARDIDDCIRTL